MEVATTSEESKSAETKVTENISIQVISELLNALIVPLSGDNSPEQETNISPCTSTYNPSTSRNVGLLHGLIHNSNSTEFNIQDEQVSASFLLVYFRV
jgi:hypothetical protein